MVYANIDIRLTISRYKGLFPNWGFWLARRIIAMSASRTGRNILGKCSNKHHNPVLHMSIKGITKPATRSLPRRGGLKWISALIHEEARAVLKISLENVIGDVVTNTEHSKRKTATADGCCARIEAPVQHTLRLR